MGDEEFDETIIIANSGSVFIRGGYGREEIWLGLSHGRSDQPDVIVELTSLQRKRLIEALCSMPSPAITDCWFCGIQIAFPVDAQGLVQCDADMVCATCGGVHQTTEDDGEIAMAPRKCGHGVEHDERCAKCEAKS